MFRWVTNPRTDYFCQSLSNWQAAYSLWGVPKSTTKVNITWSFHYECMIITMTLVFMCISEVHNNSQTCQSWSKRHAVYTVEFLTDSCLRSSVHWDSLDTQKSNKTIKAQTSDMMICRSKGGQHVLCGKWLARQSTGKQFAAFLLIFWKVSLHLKTHWRPSNGCKTLWMKRSC